MRYINKTENAAKGYQIVDTLMDDAWNEDDKKYFGFNYNGLSDKQKYGDKIIELLLSEQQDICCYCMKKIKTDETSIEHIIPQTVSETDFYQYLIVSELADNVIHKNHLNTQVKLEQLEKYPHDIAYHNLIASCISKIHCNNKRGNIFIEPFIYYNDIQDRVWYEKNGSMGSDEFIDFLEDALGLNHDQLKYIRKLWQLISKKFDTIPITPQELEDMIYDAIALDDDLVMLLERFGGKESDLSKIFYKYEWFFFYYKDLA
jgi:hypothetical protein